LLGQGAEEPVEPLRNAALDAIVEKLPKSPSSPPTGGLTSGQAPSPVASTRIDQLSDADLADLIALATPTTDTDPVLRARIGIAADAVAHDPAIRQKLAAAKTLDEQLRIVAAAVQQHVERQSTLVAAGPFDFFGGIKDRVSEGFSRVLSAPGAGLTVAAGEFRGPLNDFVTRFLGDVLYYMTLRGIREAAGKIPNVLVDALVAAQTNKEARNGEPIVLLTHSMGGQIAYDVVSAFLPASPTHRQIKVDFWCATASQVGFFEELDMFLASSTDFSKKTGKRTPFPGANLGHWWNIWDHNDIISFTANGIFDGVDDEEYRTGMSLAAAHGGYLERPSFYRAFADKLNAAFPGRTS
jgi:hypothetical protein